MWAFRCAGHILALLFAQVLVGFAFVVVAVVVVVVVVERLRLFAALRWFEVLLVEVIEQEIEENGIWHGQPHGPPWVSAVGPQQLRIVQESHAELDLLTYRRCTPTREQKVNGKETMRLIHWPIDRAHSILCACVCAGAELVHLTQ